MVWRHRLKHLHLEVGVLELHDICSGVRIEIISAFSLWGDISKEFSCMTMKKAGKIGSWMWKICSINYTDLTVHHRNFWLFKEMLTLWVVETVLVPGYRPQFKAKICYHPLLFLLAALISGCTSDANQTIAWFYWNSKTHATIMPFWTWLGLAKREFI